MPEQNGGEDAIKTAAGHLDQAARHSTNGEVTSAMSQLELAEDCLRRLGKLGTAEIVRDIREGDVCYPTVGYELRELAQFLFIDTDRSQREVVR